MSGAFIVVAGNVTRGFTHYGPFASVDEAQAWASSPLRAEQTRSEHRVVPLFGGVLASDGRRTWTGMARP